MVFLTFLTSFFSSLSIFKTVVLKSLSSRSLSSKVFLAQFLLTYSFPWSCPYFPVSLYDFVVFFVVVENWIFESNNVVTLEITLSSFPRTCCIFVISIYLFIYYF